MPTKASLPLPDSPELVRYNLARAIRDMRGAFALFPVESNLSFEKTLVFLDTLAVELAKDGLKVRLVTLGRDAWNLLAVLHEQPDTQPDECVVVLGLESTPSILPAGGEAHLRPPALNLLNVTREAIERKLNVPLVLWCVPYVYDALLKHAPDFFDHFSALFALMEDSVATEERPEHFIATQTYIEPTRHDSPLPSVESDLKFYEKRLKEFPNPSPERARALIGYSIALRERPQGDVAEQRMLAFAYAQEAESYLKQTDDVEEHARSLVNLGNAYGDLPSGDHTANLRAAIVCYESALRVYTEERFPMDWAGTQNNLGIAYNNLPSGNRAANLLAAVVCYESALRVYTEERFTMEWAMMQNNLGNAYSDLSTGDRAANLRAAIVYYESALRIYTEERFPMDWAGTQNNLGIVYKDLPSGDRAVNLLAAIACYESALRVYTEEHCPVQWATTQNNLGNAYGNLPSGDHIANLRAAIVCYESALRVYTEERFTMEWAMTQANLGLLEVKRGNYQKALERLSSARRGFKSSKHTHYLERLDSQIAWVEAQLLASES